MKKRKIILNAFLTTAVVASLQASPSENSCSFTPIDQLTPDERITIFEQIKPLFNNENINWDNVIIGITEKGDVELRLRIDINHIKIGNPSCWSI